MRESGVMIGRFQVRSLMRELGLVSKQPGSHAYRSATVERPYIPNLLNREFTAETPDSAWCADITAIWTASGWVYLATILGLATRMIVGWSMARHMRTELVESALVSALSWRRPAECFRDRRG